VSRAERLSVARIFIVLPVIILQGMGTSGKGPQRFVGRHQIVVITSCSAMNHTRALNNERMLFLKIRTYQRQDLDGDLENISKGKSQRRRWPVSIILVGW